MLTERAMRIGTISASMLTYTIQWRPIIAPRPRDQSTSVVASDLVVLSNLSDHSNLLAHGLSQHISSLPPSIKSSKLPSRIPSEPPIPSKWPQNFGTSSSSRSQSPWVVDSYRAPVLSRRSVLACNDEYFANFCLFQPRLRGESSSSIASSLPQCSSPIRCLRA
jgi:hypothetical protein